MIHGGGPIIAPSLRLFSLTVMPKSCVKCGEGDHQCLRAAKLQPRPTAAARATMTIAASHVAPTKPQHLQTDDNRGACPGGIVV